MSKADIEDFERVWATEQEPDLLAAVSHLSRIEAPDMALTPIAAQVDHLAQMAAQRLGSPPSEHAALLRFNHFLFDEMGFHGDTLDYYDPRNSFLNHVIRRRTGIPISLSVLCMVLGDRVGLRFSGIGLPGHFVVRHEAMDPAQRIYVDPFHRQTLANREACRRLVSRVAGREVHLPEEAFAPQTTRQIMVRMLANLKAAYLRRADFHRTVAVLDRLLLLLPVDAQQWRDRGLLHYQMDNYSQASFDLHRYLYLTREEEQESNRISSTLETIEDLRLRLN